MFCRRSKDLSEEDEYEDYFTRFEDSRHSLLESNLSFYNGGSHETDKVDDYETKDIVESDAHRKRGSVKESTSIAGTGKYLQSREPRKITRGVRREKSTSYQKSRTKVVSFGQECNLRVSKEISKIPWTYTVLSKQTLNLD